MPDPSSLALPPRALTSSVIPKFALAQFTLANPAPATAKDNGEKGDQNDKEEGVEESISRKNVASMTVLATSSHLPNRPLMMNVNPEPTTRLNDA